MKKLNKYFLLIFIVLMIGLVALVFWQLIETYREQFSGDFSGEQADFGAFGDYIGGLINPLIGLFTVILLGVSLYQARAGIELLHRQIRDAKIGTDEQISLLKRDRDLESIFSIIEFYRDQMKRYPDSTGNNELYGRIIDAVGWCIRNEAEEILSRRGKQMPGQFPAYNDWLEGYCSNGKNSMQLNVVYEEGYVKFHVWGGSGQVDGFWAQVKKSDPGDLCIRDLPNIYVISKCDLYLGYARTDILKSLGESWESSELKFSSHPNMFFSLEEMEQAIPKAERFPPSKK